MVAKELKAFEVAMQELMKAKLPLSRKTVERITELGFNALTYFKHVAVIIEKFIQKCKPTYKVCGLYVIDALVRYNIKQKGRKGDVLGPRFVRNFTETFEHVMKCPSKDYPKVIRVLNLWQAKKVYHHDIIQPLLDIVTKVVEGKDESRSPSIAEKDTDANAADDLQLNEGPTTPPTNENFDSYDEDADDVSYFSDDLEQTFEQPRTPPLPEPNSYPLGPGKRSPQFPTTPKQPLPPPFKPLKELSTKTLSTEDLTDDDKLTPTTSENVRKLGELLNVTSCETEPKGAGKTGATEKTNAAEFLQLLKTVNDEFSQELPSSSTKSDREARGEDLKSDLENDVLGSSHSVRKECVNIPLEYTKTVDMSAFSPISESQDFDGSDDLQIDAPNADNAGQPETNLETPASPGKGNWVPVPKVCDPELDTEPEPGLIEPEPETDFSRESQPCLSKYAKEKEKIKITVHEDESTTVVIEPKQPPSPSKPLFPDISAKARDKAKKLAKNAKIAQRTPRERKRVYREKEVSPAMQLLPSCSDLEESSETEEQTVKPTPVSVEKGARIKGAHKRKKEKTASAMKAKQERNRSSSPEKKKSKKSKKKKRKSKKSKKAKSKHKNSDDDNDDENSSSDNNSPPPEPKKLPTKSLKEELEHVNEKKKKKRKKDNFDVNRELTTDPSVNYGPHLYPKRCIIIYSTVLSISNITDLSFKQMNDLLKVYGTVLSVEMVVSLNKALVNYAERKAACCALVSLRHSHEFGISWAFPKPVSQQPWIEFWDGSVGCCVVPWNQSPPDPIKLFSDGCFIDKSTLPPPEEMPKQKRHDKKHSSDHATSGKSANQVEDSSTSSSSSIEIKRKIAQMIAKSQKASLPQEELPSPPKKSKADSTSNNNTTFKSSSFAPVDSKSPSSKFNFGWGAIKKSKDSSESKSSDVVPTSTVSTSLTPISSSSSSKNPLASGGNTDSSAYNSSMYMNAQYQSYLHSHAAAMYQHLSYQPSMYSYPYNYPYNPQDLAYAYSGGYGNYHQMYPNHTAAPSTTSSNTSPYTAFVRSEPSSQPYSTASADNLTGINTFATCTASVTSSNTSATAVNVSLQNFQNKFTSFVAAQDASSDSPSNYLSNILKSNSSYSTSPMTANTANRPGAPLPSKWSNESTSSTVPRFSFTSTTPTSNSKDVDFRIQGVGARQRQPAVNFSMLSNLVGSTSKAANVNPSFSFNQSTPATSTVANSNYVPKNAARPFPGTSSITSSDAALIGNNVAPSSSSSNVKYFFQAPNFQGEPKNKGVSFSMPSNNEKPQDPTEAAISAVKAFFSSSDSTTPTSSQINQIISPPKPPPFPPPPTATGTSHGVQRASPPTSEKNPTNQKSFSGRLNLAAPSGSGYYVEKQSNFATSKIATVTVSSSVSTPFTSATRINKTLSVSNPLCPQSSFMDIICNPSAFPIKSGNGISVSSCESGQSIVSVACTLPAPILSVSVSAVESSSEITTSRISPSNSKLKDASVSASSNSKTAAQNLDVSTTSKISTNNKASVSPPSGEIPEKSNSTTPPFPKPPTCKENAENENEVDNATTIAAGSTSEIVATRVANDRAKIVTDKSKEKYSPEDVILSNDDSEKPPEEEPNIDGDALSQEPPDDRSSSNSEFNSYFKSVRNEINNSNQEVLESPNASRFHDVRDSSQEVLEPPGVSGHPRPFESGKSVPRMSPPPCSFDERPFSSRSTTASSIREPVLSPPALQTPPEPVRIRIPIFRPRNPVSGDLILRPRVAEQNRGIFPPPAAVVNGNGTEMIRAPQLRTPPRYIRAPAVRPNFRGTIPDNARASTAGFIDKLSNEARFGRTASDRYEVGNDSSPLQPSSRPLSSFKPSPVLEPGMPGRSSFSPSIRPIRPGNNRPELIRHRPPRPEPEDFDVPLEKRAEQILRKEMQEALRAIKPAQSSGSSILSRPPVGEFNEFSYSMSVQAKVRMGGNNLDNNQPTNSDINSSTYVDDDEFDQPSTFDSSPKPSNRSHAATIDKSLKPSNHNYETRTSENSNEQRMNSNFNESTKTNILKAFVKTPHGLYRRDTVPAPRGSVGIDLDLPNL